MIQINGIATISKGTFRFDSGMPSDKSVVSAQHLLGRLHIAQNACAVFQPEEHACNNQPPEVMPVAEGEGYKLKRTSRNYIIQLKVPRVESRLATEARLKQMLAEVMGEITLDRQEEYVMAG